MPYTGRNEFPDEFVVRITWGDIHLGNPYQGIRHPLALAINRHFGLTDGSGAYMGRPDENLEANVLRHALWIKNDVYEIHDPLYSVLLDYFHKECMKPGTFLIQRKWKPPKIKGRVVKRDK